MDTNTVAHQRPTTRELRGLKLYRERGDEIEPQGRGVYLVPGCSGSTYTVDLAVFSDEESCTCPDHREHPEFTCKHLTAATLYRAKDNARRRDSRQRFSPEMIAANLARMGA